MFTLVRSTGWAIKPAPGAWFIPQLISLAQFVAASVQPHNEESWPPNTIHTYFTSVCFQGLEAVCSPIINKPKPKPKEEPPKDTKKEETADKKEAPAEENAENTTQNDAESAENTEEKGDMELDWEGLCPINIPCT